MRPVQGRNTVRVEVAQPATGEKTSPPLKICNLFRGINHTAPNQSLGRSVRVNRNRRSRPRQSGADSVGKYFGDAWSLAKRTAYGLNEVRKLINIEEKELVTTAGSVGFDVNGALVPISRIAQGTNYTERIGNSIKMQRIEVRGRIFKNASASNSVIRILLVRDLDGYGSVPAVTDIMETVGSSAAPCTQYDWLNRKRFSILFDEFLTLSSTGDSGAVFEVHLPHEGHIQYLGTTAAAASDGKGSMYMLFISDETTNTPTYTFSSRIVFTDD